MVAQHVGQMVRPVPHLAHQVGPAVAQEPQVVPEVLDPLSPRVDVLRARLAANVAEAVAPTRIAALDAGLEKLPSRLGERPRVDRLPYGVDRIARLPGGDADWWVRIRVGSPDGVPVRLQLMLRLDHLGGKLVPEPLL